MTRRHSNPPPSWPLLIINRAQWAAFEVDGYDMRMFMLQRPIKLDPNVSIWKKTCPRPPNTRPTT